jgi:NADPH:quinone reductase
VRMRAVVITRPGGPEVLELRQRRAPSPAAGEIRVRVHASALSRADLLQRRGGYPAPPGAPRDIPGLEFAGVVDAVGEGVGLWATGNRVMGIVPGGGHAEYVVLHEREAIRIPQKLSLEEAAAIPEVFLTAHDALFRILDVQVGERVLVHAVGSGVGTAALQLARAAGATVVGTSRTADKLERARELGLDHAVKADPGWPERVEQAIGEASVHAVMELVGAANLAGDLRVLAPRGRIAVIGTMAGASTEIDLRLLMQKRARLEGTVLRSRPLEEKMALAREFSRRVLPLLSSGKVVPVLDRVLPAAEVAEAHRYLEENRSFGKVVLRWD